jgi:hypothetical protein
MENILIEIYKTPDKPFAVPFVAPISSIGSNHRKKNSSSLQDRNKISGQSVQAKNVNCNPTDGVFLVFTMLAAGYD